MNNFTSPTVMQTHRKDFLFAQVVSVFFILIIPFNFPYKGFGKEPITKEGILYALSFNILSGADLIRRVEKRGVNFQMDLFDEQQIREAGSYLIAKSLDDFIETIRRNFRSPQEKPVEKMIETPEAKMPQPSGETSLLCLVDDDDASRQIIFNGPRRTYIFKAGNATYRGHFESVVTYEGKDTITGPKDIAENIPDFYVRGDGPEKMDGGDGLGLVTVELIRAFRYPSPARGPFPGGYGKASLIVRAVPPGTWIQELNVTDHSLRGCRVTGKIQSR